MWKWWNIELLNNYLFQRFRTRLYPGLYSFMREFYSPSIPEELELLNLTALETLTSCSLLSPLKHSAMDSPKYLDLVLHCSLKIPLQVPSPQFLQSSLCHLLSSPGILSIRFIFFPLWMVESLRYTLATEWILMTVVWWLKFNLITSRVGMSLKLFGVSLPWYPC